MRLLAAAGVVLAVALAGNWLLVLVGKAAGVPATFGPLSFFAVAFFTIPGVLAGVGVYALVRRFATRPRVVWRLLAYGALLLSFLPDVQLLRAPEAFPFPVAPLGVAFLVAMHVWAGVVTTEGMLRLAAP